LHRQQVLRPVTAIFSIVESCRKLDVPIRQYLADVLPGLADRSIQSLDELTLPPTPLKRQSSLSPAAQLRQS
jgi:hypothetical protein